MANNKKSFILYCDLIHTLEKMPDEKAGLLFKHLLRYVNDLNPTTNDLIVELTFEPIKQQLKRDLTNWEDELIKKGTGGSLGNLKRWHLDLYNKVINKDLSLQKALEIAKQTNVSHTDNNNRIPIKSIAPIAVNVTVNDNVINKYSFFQSLTEYGFKDNLIKEWIQVRKNKKATNTKTAFDSFIKQVELSKVDKNKVLEICIEKSWSGFKAEWIKEEIKTDKSKLAPDYESFRNV